MRTGDEVVEIESLERSLLSESVTGEEETEKETDDEPVLYTASFEEMEENFVNHQTAQWVLYSLVLILAWGIGLFMLLCIPVRRHILRRDIRSRKLYLTSNSIVYKAVLTRLSDMRTEVFSRQVSAIEDTPSLTTHPPAAWLSPPRSLKFDAISYSGDLALLQKLEEVGSSVKKVQTLIEEQRSQTSKTAD